MKNKDVAGAGPVILACRFFFIPMKRLSSLLIACAGLLLAANYARAVYAPIPEVEQGRLLTAYLSAGYYYDSNIFGAAKGEIESIVFQAQPTIVANISASQQTFLSASYQLSMDYLENRPDDKLLASHSISGRVAHAFTPRLEGELSDSFQIVKNPESLLPGIGGGVANPDQSYKYNQLDGKLAYNISKRVGLKGKARTMHMSYDNDYLSEDLDRAEYLVGVEAVRLSRENLQFSAEYRYKAIRYDEHGSLKNKDSHFLFAGADYALTKRTAYTARLGIEALFRRNGGDSALPYVELGVKHDYSDLSFISAGYTFSAQESSNVIRYTDMYTHHFFVNVQHALNRRFIVSCMTDWQPSQLNGRSNIPDIDESNLKVGGALTYTFKEKWSASLTCDYDYVHSDDSGRNLERVRFGLRARWVF
ncbi:hypothetical protein M2447_000348 [Ereboglobus sp. PH5-10]|nr:hypothetical protein [Ereboglobus sp. PH5-10]